MVTELDTLYVPLDERALRRIQKKVEEIDRRSREWGAEVVDILPKGLLMMDEENALLVLFLAQQRRLNQELDGQRFEETPFTRLARVTPFLTSPEDDLHRQREAHRTVAARLESDIDRTFESFCGVRSIDPTGEAAIDWRVAIRYLAQDVHRLACQINIRREYYTSPHRFEIALRARDLAADIVTRREIMLDSVVFTAAEKATEAAAETAGSELAAETIAQ